MAPTSTLLIKNISKNLSKLDQIEFFKGYGAVEVKLVSYLGKRVGKAFARFENEHVAGRALLHLHQQEVRGYNLVVEYVKEMPTSYDNIHVPFNLSNVKETESELLFKRFKDKLESWSAGVNFYEAVPHNLRYQYPPPTSETLANISRALTLYPKLYTQVLHLMNKMNLPCPISDEVSQAPISVNHLIAPSVAAEPTTCYSESESELSGEEFQSHEIIPNIKPPAKKILKRSKLIKPPLPVSMTKSKKISYTEVFDDPKSVLEPPKKKFKPIVDTCVTLDENAQFGFVHPPADLRKVDETEVKPDLPIRNEMEEERLEKERPEAISLKELAANRLPVRDREVLSVYKNYVEGAPTCRLYIKNLSKQSTEKDIRFIYSAFWTEPEGDSPNMFDVRIMQEGRMKGQAFVTLQSVDLARKALAETNGYILNDKPMVVQFARSATK